LKSDLCILQFFQHFERVVEQKRHKELEAEYNAREKLPTLSLKNSPLLKQAAQVYTPAIFKMFQNEYDYASAALIKSRNESQPMHEYIVMLFGQEKEYIKYFATLLIRHSCVVVGSLKHLEFCVVML
jgi:zinc finger SWIM domain-containing protein 3